MFGGGGGGGGLRIRLAAVTLDPYDDTVNEGDIRQLAEACHAPQLAAGELREGEKGGALAGSQAARYISPTG